MHYLSLQEDGVKPALGGRAHGPFAPKESAFGRMALLLGAGLGSPQLALRASAVSWQVAGG